MYERRIEYDHETRDYAMYLRAASQEQFELVGFARTYDEGEETLEFLVSELIFKQVGITQGDAKRFWRKVKITDACWEWAASTNGRYGQIYFNRKVIHAHVFSYILHHGAVPNGLIVRHACDNPACVNPAHLELGTYADNTADMMERERNAYIVHSGEANGRAKLTTEQVHHIRSTYTGKFGEAAALARQYGITKTTVSRLLRGLSWSTGAA